MLSKSWAGERESYREEESAEEAKKAAREEESVDWKRLKGMLPRIEVSELIAQYTRDLVMAARNLGCVAVGPSTNGSEALVHTAR